nr:unnamed protein product [Callosobruchus chinensis]
MDRVFYISSNASHFKVAGCHFQGPPSTTQQPYIGCREVIRRSMLQRGVPGSAISAILSSISEGTLK